jgi:WD40-like Beta Propeller Repeat
MRKRYLLLAVLVACTGGQHYTGIDADVPPKDGSKDGPVIDGDTTCRLRVVFVDGKPPFSGLDDGSGLREVWISNPDGSGLVNLSNNSNADDAHPSPSPDGLKVAFASNRTGKYDIFVVNIDGTALVNLTSGPDISFDASNPVWSPDGTRIAFSMAGNVWTMNANGTGATKLSTVPVSGAVAWSPDSKQLVFDSFSAPSTFALYVIHVGGGSQAVKLNSGNPREEGVSWAPFSKITFDNSSDVFTVDGNGGGIVNVTQSATFQNRGAVVVGNGSAIVFSGTRDSGHIELWSIPASGGMAVQVTHNAISLSSDNANAASPDGALLAFVRRKQTVQSDNSVTLTSQLGVVGIDGNALHLFNSTDGSNAVEAKFSVCR